MFSVLLGQPYSRRYRWLRKHKEGCPDDAKQNGLKVKRRDSERDDGGCRPSQARPIIRDAPDGSASLGPSHQHR